MIRIDVITIFPEFFAGPLGISIPGRAQDAGVVQRHDTSVGTFLQVYTHGLALRMAVATEVVPYGLHIEVQFPRYAVDASIRQVVLDPPQLIEGDVHDGWDFGLMTPTR